MRSNSLDGLDDIQTLGDRSENNMLSIEPTSLGSAQEELTSVGTWSSVSHTEDTWSGVLEFEVLILELVTVDGFSSSTVVVGEVATL